MHCGNPLLSLAFRLTQLVDDMVQEFVDSSYSQGHRKNLITYSSKYQEFCELLQLIPFPADETQITRYIAYLTLTFSSPKSIQNYVSAVKKLHYYARVPVPQYSKFLDIVMDGVKRVLDHVVTQAPAITPDMLSDISKIVNKKDPRQVVLFTAMLLAFYLFLRSSNYAAKTRTTFNPDKQLLRSDVTFAQKVALVHIKWSKTIQFRQKKLLIPLISISSKHICPFTWLRYMVQLIPAPSDAPLFVFPSRGALTPLTYTQLNDQLKTWISQIGLRGKKFSSHGLRRGGASWAFRMNLPSLAIKLLGDWASEAFQNYIQYDIESRLRAMMEFTKEL